MEEKNKLRPYASPVISQDTLVSPCNQSRTPLASPVINRDTPSFKTASHIPYQDNLNVLDKIKKPPHNIREMKSNQNDVLAQLWMDLLRRTTREQVIDDVLKHEAIIDGSVREYRIRQKQDDIMREHTKNHVK